VRRGVRYHAFRLHTHSPVCERWPADAPSHHSERDASKPDETKNLTLRALDTPGAGVAAHSGCHTAANAAVAGRAPAGRCVHSPHSATES
jgi:hypothetical protein